MTMTVETSPLVQNAQAALANLKTRIEQAEAEISAAKASQADETLVNALIQGKDVDKKLKAAISRESEAKTLLATLLRAVPIAEEALTNAKREAARQISLEESPKYRQAVLELIAAIKHCHDASQNLHKVRHEGLRRLAGELPTGGYNPTGFIPATGSNIAFANILNNLVTRWIPTVEPMLNPKQEAA